MDSGLKIAVVQSDPQVGIEKLAVNMEESKQWVEKSASAGANLVVFPELNATGYVFLNRKEAFAHSQSAERGEAVELWKELSRKHNMYIAGSFVEREGERLYDTAVLIGPGGMVGKYRKTHLWNRENLYFSPGDLGYPVFDTEFGRIGLLICWDTWFPETFRIMGVQGADLVCTLNNWVYTPGPLFDESGRCMAVYHTMSAAQANGLFIAAANRVGTERGEKFLGNSVIVGPNGWPIEIAGTEEETLLVAEVDLAEARRTHWSDFNDLYKDRRTDLYDERLGYRKKTEDM